MIETFSQMVAYWEAMPTHVTGLNSVIVGDEETTLESQNSRIKYPCLCLETPPVRFSGIGGVPTKVFDWKMSLVVNEPTRTNAEANRQMNDTLVIMERIVTRLMDDMDDGLFVVIMKDEQMEPMRRWSGDNGFGWEGTISIELPRCECEDCD